MKIYYGNIWSSAILAFAFLCGSFGTAFAIIDANSRTNTSPPPDGSPWFNIGSVNGGTGIYLGNGWVLTVYHIGAGDTYFNGSWYPWDGTSIRLTNSTGTATDLNLFHLASAPALPTLSLTATTPAAASLLDMIGWGRMAGSSETNLGSLKGFYWTAGTFHSWGKNKVASGGLLVIDAGLGPLTTFHTDFSAPGSAQTSDEAQGASGDSGSGVFQLNGTNWVLVGVVDAVSTATGQPANSAAYGNFTYIADVATYRNQILSIIGRTGLPRLSIQEVAGSVQVCWPDTALGFNLEATTSLKPAAWSTVLSNVSTTNGQGCALIPTSGNARFLRLRK